MNLGQKYHAKPVDQTLRGVQKKETFFQQIVEHSVDAILLIDSEGIVRFLNPAGERLFERSTEQMIGQVFGFPIHSYGPQELDIVRPGVKDSRVAEMRVGQIESGGETFYVANLRDVTDLVRLREELRVMSLIDELTGLCNRRGFLNLAQQQLKIANRTQQGLLLIFIDLDDMKWINDTLGHHVGDLALIETANLLKETFRESDIIARIGGDEFVVLAIEVRKDSAEILTGRLQKKVDARNSMGNHRYKLSISIGTTRYDPECEASITGLMTQADALMYEHKRSKQRSYNVTLVNSKRPLP
jgi:diguanylate cyclase (GGDEF)-like protein